MTSPCLGTSASRRPKALQPCDVPGWEAEILGRLDDAVNVIVGGGLALWRRGDIAKRRPPFAALRFDKNGFGQIGADPVLGIEGSQLLVRSSGERAVNAMLLRRDQVRKRLDADVEAR